MNFRYKLMRFLSGRYGTDETAYVMIIIASVLAVINCFLRFFILQLIVYTLILLTFIRAFSRNIEARRAENRKVKNIIDKIKNSARQRSIRKADYTHVYKKCPACKAVLRLPRKKGKHTTVCPKCNKKFTVHVYKD